MNILSEIEIDFVNEMYIFKQASSPYLRLKDT